MLRDRECILRLILALRPSPPPLRAVCDKSENWEKSDHRQSEALVLLRQMLTLHSDGLLLSAEQDGNQ